jgi:hypothetical protein
MAVPICDKRKHKRKDYRQPTIVNVTALHCAYTASQCSYGANPLAFGPSSYLSKKLPNVICSVAARP